MSEDLHTHDVVEKYKLNNFLNIQIYLKNDTLHEYILEYFLKLTMFLTSIIITQFFKTIPQTLSLHVSHKYMVSM